MGYQASHFLPIVLWSKKSDGLSYLIIFGIQFYELDKIIRS